jgi:hypothetical protein
MNGSQPMPLSTDTNLSRGKRSSRPRVQVIAPPLISST